jgi:hypothetical protein
MVSERVAIAENIDPDDDGSQYAYAENVGWLNAEPSGDGGPGVHVADAELTGWMWGENVGWVSLSCQNTSSCGSVDYGVTNDGVGNLAGYAWAENVGWVSMSCENTSSCGSVAYGVDIDPLSGDFSGRAWGENIGWITFASTGGHPYKVQANWCSPPTGSLSLLVGKSGNDAQLTWSSPLTSTTFDVVQGDLSTLVSSDGDFSTSTEACIGENESGSFLNAGGTPDSGEAFWYLVRGDCGGGYDTGGPGQAGTRDAEIAASGNDCM